MILDHHDALSKAKIQLMSRPDSAFFVTLCFSLKHIWDETHRTAYTDGKVIAYNPKFFMGLSVEERVFVILHECLHVAFLHTLRIQEGMCRRKANIAMDHVINLILIAAGFKMPVIGLADPKYTGLCWEEVYKLLPDDSSEPMMDDLRPSDTTEEGIKKVTREVEDILVRAATQSKLSGDKPGSIPGDIQIFLNGLLHPKLPWQRILQRYLQSFVKNDYTFKKPNRRFFPKHYLPSLYGEKLIDLTVAVDISGSVSDRDFHFFITEVASILRMMKPEKISLILFDTNIKSVTEVKSIKELMSIRFTGRGGTAINPVLEWINQKKPQLSLVFSDGCFTFYETEAKTPMLWLIHNNKPFNAPFGKTIHYEI